MRFGATSKGGTPIPYNPSSVLGRIQRHLSPRTQAILASAIVVSLMGTLVMIARAQSDPEKPPVRLTVAASPSPAVTPTASPSASPSPSPSPSPTATATPPPPPVVVAVPPPKPAPKPAPVAPKPAAVAPRSVPSTPGLIAYRGLGAWVSLYDFVFTNAPIDPAQATQAMANRGVQTLYLQTSRWNLPDDITGADLVAQFIEHAHDHGIRVVGWYLPGFADVNLDVRRSMAVINFKTPNGQHFDGLAPDIEDRSAVNHNAAAFDAGIVAYSK
ncbi:MAG TPA: hypothetical protein VG779_08210, partial [Actinomycetota bacterium]|nr:hypothetical protein [Actinomycetota bacterium]